MNQPASQHNQDTPSIDGDQKITVAANEGILVDTPLTEIVDKDVVVLALMYDVQWEKKVRNPGYKTIFYYRQENLRPILDTWQSPAPIMVDYRKLISATRIFNSAVHEG